MTTYASGIGLRVGFAEAQCYGQFSELTDW